VDIFDCVQCSMEENYSIQIQLNTILSELSNLKQEVHWTKANVAAMEDPPPSPAYASPVASSAISVETAHMSEPPVSLPLPKINPRRNGSDDTKLFSDSDSARLEGKYDLEQFLYDYFEYESGQKGLF